MLPRPPAPTLFPYTTLFRSRAATSFGGDHQHAMSGNPQAFRRGVSLHFCAAADQRRAERGCHWHGAAHARSEEHTSELQSRGHLVCRLLLEKKKEKNRHRIG